ncbi:MAG TPA: NAD(P)H-dependent oxidoreductase [Rhodobacterales bacterium]|nr:NAD(P)H-dependent oxidoreductase [Rhodobacterales bacterium]
MRLLAISGSMRAASTNTAFLHALAGLAPQGVSLSLLSGLDALPIFNPDLEGHPPETVRRFVARIEAAEGLIISSPEYIRALPGGLKNAIDWLVSGEVIIAKPVALAHASHRGDDMLADLRRVLATVSTRFSPDIFLRVPLMKLTPREVAAHLAQPEPGAQARAFLADFAAFCADPA